MKILGINSYHPDSSAAIVTDGQLIVAVEEERFSRIKYYAGFPTESIKCCLEYTNISIEDIDYIAIPRKRNARLLKKIYYGLKIPELTRSRAQRWGKTYDLKNELVKVFGIDKNKIKAKIIEVEHHRAHLASSFFVSGFNKAFLFSCDALGDFASTMWGVGSGNKINVSGEITFPHSLGFFYTAITQYLGFRKFGDEYKVMGLAPYGEPAYIDEFRKIIKTQRKGFTLDLKYFLHHKKYIKMDFENLAPNVDIIFSPYLEERLGKRRKEGEPIEKRDKDIACSLQKRLEEVVVELVNAVSPREISHLCLAGGVAHNCALNGKLLRETHFTDIYVPPAPGDAGLSVGAAIYLNNHLFNNSRDFIMKHAYWGPHENSNCSIEVLERKDIMTEEVDDYTLCKKIAKEIADGKIVGWVQGKMEFGPRALGARSILADPRRSDMKDILNKKIKIRETFRPFAPSILEEHTPEYFQKDVNSPFMSFICRLKEDKRQMVPAVCHVNGTARLQTVNKTSSPIYWKLIDEFRRITGVPILLNTSFNENEPIVCSEKEAMDCFLRTEMDVLVLGNRIIRKKAYV